MSQQQAKVEVEVKDVNGTYTEYRNNAQNILNLRINTTASTEACHEQIQKVVETLCPFLIQDDKDKEDDHCHSRFQIKPLTGGLSNHLFLVSNSNFAIDTTARTPSTVLVRIHPDNNNNNYGNNNTDNKDSETNFSIVNRELETRFAAWLANQREELPHNTGTMAPTVYGRFENGRVEEFYQNVRPLSWGEMKSFAPKIAQSLASFHSLDAPPTDVLPRPAAANGDGNITSTIYDTIPAWLEEANKTQLNNDTKEFFMELCQEWVWLENELASPPPPQQQSTDDSDSDNSIVAEALDFIRRVVVTHMDCQPLNILINDKKNDDKNDDALDTLRLIDFEYSGWNPIAADIANTFCEYCEMSNLRADYEKEYPTPAQQDDFFWHYLAQSDPVRAKRFSSYLRRQEQQQKEGGYDSDSDDREWDLFCTTMQREVGRFSLLSHLGWAIWSIVKAQEEDGVDFDYMVYARHRMDGYAWAKNKFMVQDYGTRTVGDYSLERTATK